MELHEFPDFVLKTKIDVTNFRYLKNFKKDGGLPGVPQSRTTSAIPGKFTGFFGVFVVINFSAQFIEFFSSSFDELPPSI